MPRHAKPPKKGTTVKITLLLELLFLNKLNKGNNVKIALPRFSVMVCCNDFTKC